MIEFIPWYEPGTALVRCLLCGGLLSSGDIELHTNWHEKIGG